MQRDPAAPPVLDGYTAVRVLGLGGFSDVFLYEQELPRRPVAVKVLSGQLTDAVRSAFVREANLMAALSTHPYIVTIYQAGVAGDGRPYLVMEYCSRPSLAERYKRQPLTVADALRTGIRIAGAVATLHSAGILHRDIKPANVLTNDYGAPALTDFGIATAFEQGGVGSATLGAGVDPGDAQPAADALADETGSGTIGLSVPWSPPEMFVDVPDPDVRADVFSLAATLYTVLAGRTPFEVRGGPNGQLDLISRIERGEVTPMTRTDLPASLQAALARGMAPRREDRWPSALEFARALQRVELELGYAPTAIEVPELDADRSPDDEEDEDATRMRAMPTVVAQPPSAPTTPPGAEREAGTGVGGGTGAGGTGAGGTAAPVDSGAPAAGSAGGAGSGGRAASGAAPGSTAPLPAATPSAALGLGSALRPSRRGTITALVIGGLAILAVAAIILSVLLSGPPSPQVDGPTPARTGGSAVGPEAAAPTKGTAVVSPDGTSVTFAWTNPRPEKGDVYYWARSETPDERQIASDPQAVVTGVVPGSRVCIDVAVGRASGRTSPVTRICTAP